MQRWPCSALTCRQDVFCHADLSAKLASYNKYYMKEGKNKYNILVFHAYWSSFSENLFHCWIFWFFRAIRCWKLIARGWNNVLKLEILTISTFKLLIILKKLNFIHINWKNLPYVWLKFYRINHNLNSRYVWFWRLVSRVIWPI